MYRSRISLDACSTSWSWPERRASRGWSFLLLSSIRLPRSSIMSGFFWSSWSKLVRAHRVPPPQLRYTTYVALVPGQDTRTVSGLVETFAEPPTFRTPRPAASTVTAGPAPGRSFTRHRHAPSPRQSLGLPPFPSSRPVLMILLGNSAVAACKQSTQMVIGGVSVGRWEDHISRGDQSFFSHTRKD